MAIEGYNKAVIEDLRGKGRLEFEINFSEDPKFKECVRASIGSEELIIPIKDLFGFVMMVGNEEQQADLVPVQQTLVRKIVKMHKVRVTKPIKPGEFLNVRCETNVPVEVFEGLSGLMGRKVVRKSSSILLPSSKV